MRILYGPLIVLMIALLTASPGLSRSEPGAAQNAEASVTRSDEAAPPIRALVFAIEPICFQDAEGRWKGLECEILQSFAEAVGRELILLEQTSFPAFGAAMAAGDFDIAMAALTITPERRRRFDFSDGYFPSMAFLVERRGEESDRLSDLRGEKVGLLRGAVHEEILSRESGIEIVFGETVEEMYGWLIDGEIQGMVTENIDYLATINIHPQLTASMSISERGFYGAAMPLGSPLKSAFDAHLETIKRDGRFREILISAFGQWGVEAIDDLAEGMFDP